MRKMLLTLTTVGVLAVPAGMALAQSDTTEPAEPVPTCVDPVRDRDRDHSEDHGLLGAQDQVRTQQQTQAHLDDGTCDADCEGEHARVQDRTRLQDQTQLDEGASDGAMHRTREMGKAGNG